MSQVYFVRHAIHEMHHIKLKSEEIRAQANLKLPQRSKYGLQLLAIPFHTACQPYQCLATTQNGSGIQEDALTANRDIYFPALAQTKNMLNVMSDFIISVNMARKTCSFFYSDKQLTDIQCFHQDPDV